MNLPAQFRDLLFKLLAGLTSPLRGYRTAIGIAGALAMIVYGVLAGNLELAGIALTVLLGLIGLRPEEPPDANQPAVPMKAAALFLALTLLAGGVGCSRERGCYSTDGREAGQCRCCMKCDCGGGKADSCCCCK